MSLNKSSTVPVKRPTSRNGIINPNVYTPISKKPISFESEADTINNTLLSTGPIHGVHAKLKVKPKTNAVSGFMANFPILKGRRCSDSIILRRLNIPNWYNPNIIIINPLIIIKTIYIY